MDYNYYINVEVSIMDKICPLNGKGCKRDMCGFWCNKAHECSIVTLAIKAYNDNL